MAAQGVGAVLRDLEGGGAWPSCTATAHALWIPALAQPMLRRITRSVVHVQCMWIIGKLIVDLWGGLSSRNNRNP